MLWEVGHDGLERVRGAGRDALSRRRVCDPEIVDPETAKPIEPALGAVGELVEPGTLAPTGGMKTRLVAR